MFDNEFSKWVIKGYHIGDGGTIVGELLLDE